jgi:peptidoglycan/LPS O-acetylase OafA/YrhL
MTLKEGFDPQKNSLDFLRFVLAFAVIIGHGFWLSGFKTDPIHLFTHGQVSMGLMVVAGFFLLSGFLITRSRQRISSFWQFLWQRCRRILPGFWVCLLVTVVLFAPIMYWLVNKTLAGYWEQTPFGPFDYLKNNFFLRIQQDRIGNLFQDFPLFPYLINGSLWTLYDEFKCYLIIGVLGIFGVTRERRWVVLLLTVTVCGVYIFETVTGGYLRRVLSFFFEQFFLEHLAYFLIGSTAFLYAERIPMRRGLLFLSIGLVLVSGYFGYYSVVALFALSYTLFWLVIYLPVTKWAKYGDFSYGMYLYALPIQRILGLLGLSSTGIGVVWYILEAAVVTAVFAVLSYYLVESRFFKRGSSASTHAHPIPSLQRVPAQ